MKAASAGWAFVGLLAGCFSGAPAPCPDHSDPAGGPIRVETGGPVYQSVGNPFVPGPLDVQVVDVPQCRDGAPTAVRLYVPAQAGRYATVSFHHGFLLRNRDYESVLSHLASHGFVVIAPQMYELGPDVLFGRFTAFDEADLAGRVLEWFAAHPGAVGAPGVEVDLSRLGIAGHSRGGKVAWRLLLNDPRRAQAVAGIDPVDGTGWPASNQGRVVSGLLDHGVPSLVVGLGRAGDCAPEGDNHVQFFAASPSPAWHVVAPEVGHGDVLDDAGANFFGPVCGVGAERESARRLVAGLMAAFFRGTLQGDAAALEILDDPAVMPAAVVIERR